MVFIQFGPLQLLTMQFDMAGASYQLEI